MFPAVAEIKDDLERQHPGFQFFHSRSGSGDANLQSTGLMDGAVDLDEAVMKESNPNPEPKALRDSIGTNDNLLYIYTSGTTGLPKAVIIKHVR